MHNAGDDYRVTIARITKKSNPFIMIYSSSFEQKCSCDAHAHGGIKSRKILSLHFSRDGGMKRATRPEKSVYLVWLSVAMTFCWPLPADTARRRIVGMKVLLIISIINGCAVILAMLYWVHLHLNDVISLFKCICVALCLLQYVVQAAVCLVKYDTLQVSSRFSKLKPN